ncbi:hypothetical protein AB6A40_009665 [Gnathostoma spinigerum]|uniref:Uncharacterized protein n=1 Tax=Gnathostoma spinigerum TaxID=75299 RepID=A0ABD6ESX3_9BILA
MVSAFGQLPPLPFKVSMKLPSVEDIYEFAKAENLELLPPDDSDECVGDSDCSRFIVIGSPDDENSNEWRVHKCGKLAVRIRIEYR